MIYTKNNGYGWTTSSVLYKTMIDRLNSRSIFWSLFKFNLGTVEILKAHPNWCSKKMLHQSPISRRCDEDVALAAVTSDFTAFQHVPLALKANRLIALAAVKQSARIFKSLPEDVKADREARKHWIMEDGWWSWLGSYDHPSFLLYIIIVYHLLKIIRECSFWEEIIMALVHPTDVAILPGLWPHTSSEDPSLFDEVALAAVGNDGFLLTLITPKLQHDRLGAQRLQAWIHIEQSWAWILLSRSLKHIWESMSLMSFALEVLELTQNLRSYRHECDFGRCGSQVISF